MAHRTADAKARVIPAASRFRGVNMTFVWSRKQVGVALALAFLPLANGFREERWDCVGIVRGWEGFANDLERYASHGATSRC